MQVFDVESFRSLIRTKNQALPIIEPAILAKRQAELARKGASRTDGAGSRVDTPQGHGSKKVSIR